MYLKETSILPPDEVLQLIEEAGNAELCRDIDSMQSALERVWDDFDQSPDFSLTIIRSKESYYVLPAVSFLFMVKRETKITIRSEEKIY